MHALFSRNHGGILGDDMGLGKRPSASPLHHLCIPSASSSFPSYRCIFVTNDANRKFSTLQLHDIVAGKTLQVASFITGLFCSR
jgi:hypothetical protein